MEAVIFCDERGLGGWRRSLSDAPAMASLRLRHSHPYRHHFALADASGYDRITRRVMATLDAAARRAGQLPHELRRQREAMVKSGLVDVDGGDTGGDIHVIELFGC